jgi:hypothetical protein
MHVLVKRNFEAKRKFNTQRYEKRSYRVLPCLTQTQYTLHFLSPACKECARNHVRRFSKPNKKAAHILRLPVVFDAPSCSELWAFIEGNLLLSKKPKRKLRGLPEFS